MNLSDTMKKDETAEKILRLIEEGKNAKRNEKRGEAIKFLEEAHNLYENLLQEKGKLYIGKYCSEISPKLNELISILTEYNS